MELDTAIGKPTYVTFPPYCAFRSADMYSIGLIKELDTLLTLENYDDCTFRSADTDTIGLIKELEALLTLENYNGLTLQASQSAYENARRFIENAGNGMILPKPEITPDGEGGIDIEWENRGRHLALSCRAEPNQDFISWRESEGRYEGNEATETLLIDRLNWLTS